MILKDKPFDKEIYNKYLKHENIDNLRGLEVEPFTNGKLDTMLIFDINIALFFLDYIDNKNKYKSYFYKKIITYHIFLL